MSIRSFSINSFCSVDLAQHTYAVREQLVGDVLRPAAANDNGNSQWLFTFLFLTAGASASAVASTAQRLDVLASPVWAQPASASAATHGSNLAPPLHVACSKVSDIVRLRQTYISGKKPLLSVYSSRHSSD